MFHQPLISKKAIASFRGRDGLRQPTQGQLTDLLTCPSTLNLLKSQLSGISNHIEATTKASSGSLNHPIVF